MANKEELQKAIDVIFNHLNAMNTEESLSEILNDKMRTEHRTIQQNFMRELNNFFVEYQQSYSDQRNENSVQFAKDIAKLEAYFPFI